MNKKLILIDKKLNKLKKAYVDPYYWVGKKMKDGRIVPPKTGLCGYTKKNIDEAIKEYEENYPRSTFVKCRCVFIEEY